MGTWVQVPSTHIIAECDPCACNPSFVEWNRWVPGALWPDCLAKPVNFRFNESLRRVRLNMKEEGPSSLPLAFPFKCVGAHTTRAHTHTHRWQRNSTSQMLDCCAFFSNMVFNKKSIRSWAIVQQLTLWGWFCACGDFLWQCLPALEESGSGLGCLLQMNTY